MAVVAGLVITLVLLVGYYLLGAGLRNPQWLVAIGLIVFAMYKYGSQQLAEDIQHVQISAQYQPACPDQYVHVTVTNNDARNIVGLSFKTQAFRPKYSEEIANHYERTDRIVAPGETWKQCWAVDQLDDVDPTLLRRLRWEAEITRIKFEQ